MGSPAVISTASAITSSHTRLLRVPWMLGELGILKIDETDNGYWLGRPSGSSSSEEWMLDRVKFGIR